MRPKPGIILVINNVYVPPEIDQLIAWIISEEVVPPLATGAQTHQGLVPYLMTFSISRSAALGSLKRFMEMIVGARTHLHTLSF